MKIEKRELANESNNGGNLCVVEEDHIRFSPVIYKIEGLVKPKRLPPLTHPFSKLAILNTISCHYLSNQHSLFPSHLSIPPTH